MSRNMSLNIDSIKVVDPKKYARLESYANHLNAELKRLLQINSTEMRLKACSELAHLFYHGGVLEPILQEDPRAIDTLLTIALNSKEPLALRVQSLQTLSSLCMLTDQVKTLLCERKAVFMLVRLFQDTNGLIRRWSVHCVFLLMLKHHRKYTQMLKGSFLYDTLMSIAMEDWSQFRHNDAERFLQVIKGINKT